MQSKYITNKTLGHIRITKEGIFFIILLNIAFLRQSGLVPMYYLTAVFVSAFIFLYAFIKYSRSKRARLKYVFEIGKMMLLPWVVFIINNILIYATNNGNSAFIKSSFVQILIPPILILGALSYYFIFRERALRYFIYAIVFHYIFIQTFQFVIMGPDQYFKGIITVFYGNSVGNPFETNSDLVLSLGLLLIYYCDDYIKLKDKQKKHALLIAILIILGGKKISFIAVLGICIFFVLSKWLTNKRRTKIEVAVSVVLIIASFGFIYLIDSGLLSAYTYTHGINTMGRVKMYDYVAQFMDLKISYLGKGYSFANLILERDSVLTYNGIAYGLHSDVLKMFLEMGTIVFAFWLIYTLIIVPRYMSKRYGTRLGNLYWFLTTLYLFVTYLTDNTISYFITQTLFIVITLHAVNLSKTENENIYMKIR